MQIQCQESTIKCAEKKKTVFFNSINNASGAFNMFKKKVIKRLLPMTSTSQDKTQKCFKTVAWSSYASACVMVVIIKAKMKARHRCPKHKNIALFYPLFLLDHFSVCCQYTSENLKKIKKMTLKQEECIHHAEMDKINHLCAIWTSVHVCVW